MSKGDAVSLIGKVELSGDFFTHDPGKTLRHNVADMMDALADWLDEEARAGMAVSGSDEALRHTRGYSTSVKTSKHWRVSAAANIVNVGMQPNEAIRVMAKVYGRHDATAGHGTTVGIEKRFHPFRRVKSGVYRARPIIQANLAKGLE